MISPQRISSSLKSFAFNRYVIFIIFLIGYTGIMEKCGGFPSVFSAWRLEIPLLVYLYYYCNLITRQSRFQSIMAAAPIVLFYSVFDVYYLFLGRMLRLNEVTELPEMVQVLPMWSKISALLLFGLSLLGLLASIQWRRIRPMILGSLPILAILLAVEVFPDAFMTIFEKTQKEIVSFSDILSAASNGRISMALYNEARRQSVLEKTTRYRDNPFYLFEFAKVLKKIKAQLPQRNVHLIVLESFIDPELFRKAHFSRKPTHPSFEKIFKKKGGFSVSPVFGGGTAQAEFELLCGVPALRELSGVEFNLFTGAKTPCLPNVLAQGGYHTIATNAFRPDFFNSIKAYEGLGFEKTYYPGEYAPSRETYFSTGDVTGEKYMFDGTLFTQNLKFIEHWIKEHPGTPLFNYIVSMYGHTPNDINTSKRPEVITVQSEFKDDQFKRAVNQHYYRTKAIADFVQELMKIDPKSLIILVSDHLPPLACGPNTYRGLNYLVGVKDSMHLNRIFFVENGRTVQYNIIHHYDVPYIIINYVAKGEKGRDFVRNFTSRKIPFDISSYRKAYMTIMAQAMDIKNL
ncbi:MAG: LTA synthase family protein [Pseudomonadota bacterium]